MPCSLCACDVIHITTMFDAVIKGLGKHINLAWQWQNEEGYNLFHVAVLSGNTAIATQIYTNFVQQDNNKLKLRTKNDEGILSLACRSENTDMVKWVLKLLDNQAKDEIIYTATDSFNSLMRACRKGNANMVKLLLAYYQKEQDEAKIFTKLLSNKEYNVYTMAQRNKHNQGFLITLELNTFLDKTFGKEKRKYFVSYCDREVLIYSQKIILEKFQALNNSIKRSTERNTHDINEVAIAAAVAVVNYTRMTRPSNDHENEQESQSQELINPASVPQSLFGSSANSSNNPTNTTPQPNTASQPRSTRERSLSN